MPDMTLLSGEPRSPYHERRASLPLKSTIFNVPHVTPPVQNTLRPSPQSPNSTLLSQFIAGFKEAESFKSGKPVVIDGYSLSIPAVTAAARFNAPVVLNGSPDIRERVDKSRKIIQSKLDQNKSIYGVSTGFGGTDTRTNDHNSLGNALLQHQHSGVLPSKSTPPEALPLSDPVASSSMPEAWVRGAMLVRINSLIRGHSGVRWDLIETMVALLRENITPMVPLRGSISASGDLSPLSYVAGTIMGNPSIRVFDGPRVFGSRQIVSSRKALTEHGLEALPLLPKEQLGILNGTAFSASVAALALSDAAHLALLAQVCTAMGTEALLGTKASHVPFLHNVARPHPGQVEVAANILNLLKGSKLATSHEEEDVTIDEDKGTLRQDRYPLRTSPQFIGPQVEDILHALATVTQECNSTTDNPLIENETGIVHHGGNFQAMAVTNAMEKTRLALHHLGKLLFAQSTELQNPQSNRGLPPNLAATDPSTNFHGKGIDIATAAYVSELGYLANPVSTHIQSAEMHNQAVNSLALISARATINSIEVLSMLVASYIYVLCQALDLRAMQAHFNDGVDAILADELAHYFGGDVQLNDIRALIKPVTEAVHTSLEATTCMDTHTRMATAAAATSSPLVDFLTSRPDLSSSLVAIADFRAAVTARLTALHQELQIEFLTGEHGQTPASVYLGRTRRVYEYVRSDLGIAMHGMENHMRFANGLGVDEVTIGQNVSLIYEAIRDGKMQKVVVDLFEEN
ncbi:phenylalanine ammonia-lyase [Rickenella mellea]|uniref:Phenylalanine ammonia-lyase n=1 Tax=Rickenella mellea TaxID=50990 RepID=A0A4Y7Q880_9AGAM|nr:phenylalanine ammonia-lyase [Rickenella mellea]